MAESWGAGSGVAAVSGTVTEPSTVRPAEPKLPPDWLKQYSKSKGSWYWFNTKTG